jgi:hypothetical protein
MKQRTAIGQATITQKFRATRRLKALADGHRFNRTFLGQ